MDPLGSISISVTNNGSVISDDAVLAFMVPPNPGQNGNPIKYLFGFNREHLIKPQQTVIVNFPVTAWDLSLVDIDGKRSSVKGTWKVVVDVVTPSEWEIVVE